jgi:hypothetical protein
MLQLCHIVLCLEIFDQNRPVCWSIVVKETPVVGSPLSRAFPSDRIPKAKKDINVRFFIHCSNSSKLYEPSDGTSEVTTYHTNVW